MTTSVFLIVLFSVFIVFSVIHTITNKKKPFQRAFLSMLIGPVLLIAICLTSQFTEINLQFSMLSVLISVIGGVPGVGLMISVNSLFF